MKPRAQLSFVIPVYNGSPTIGTVVERIFEVCRDLDIEIVLINDGSLDDSEQVCRELHRAHPETLTFVHLARNFGEHNAVLAGLSHSTGDVAILDDDGQNPPEEVRRMYDEIRATGQDVIFGRYQVKHHSWLRNVGSRFNDRIANVMLKKPRDLYLSSCKVMNRFLVEEITRYTGAFPYIDGLILRTTSSLGQIDIEHRDRQNARSNYTLRKLFLLWLNMFLNFSIHAVTTVGRAGHGRVRRQPGADGRGRHRQAVLQSGPGGGHPDGVDHRDLFRRCATADTGDDRRVRRTVVPRPVEEPAVRRTLRRGPT